MYPRIISDLIYRQYTYSETFNFNVVYGFRLSKSCFVHKYSQQWHNRCHWCSLSRANLAARSGVGRAGGRAAVLGRVHGAARVHLPAAVAAHLLRGPVPPRYVSSRLY